MRTNALISETFNKLAEVYKFFGKDFGELDWSYNAKVAMYLYTKRKKKDRTLMSRNGYFVGKSIADVQITFWKEDIKSGRLTLDDILSDPMIPVWWVRKAMKAPGISTHRKLYYEDDEK